LKKGLFVRHQILRYGSYTGGNPASRHHPFHCWSVLHVHFPEPLSQPETGIIKNGQKTLGWPTIIDGFAKMSSFDNPGISTRTGVSTRE